jgi:cysteinyl-tRNA synthetase
LYGTLRDLAGVATASSNPVPDELVTALADDLNTPEALAVLARLADNARKAGPAEQQNAKASLLGAGAFLGLLQQDPEAWFQQGSAGDEIDTQWIERLLGERADARKRKDFATSDRIRDELAAKGIVIEDGAQGARWKRVSPAGSNLENA